MTRALMLVSDRRAPGAPPLPALAASAAAAGVDMVQVREKDLPGRALLELVQAVVAATAAPTRVIVNGRADVAVLAGARGVQLPAAGLPAADVRAAFPELQVGVSCHSVDEVRRAEQAGAHYVVLGPVFASGAKDQPLGLDVLAAAARAAALPVIAIGGIDAANAGAVWAAGASGLAAIRAFLHVPLGPAVRALRHERPA
jgi:thiamine-phosphate pyrophosphorylase